MKEAKEHVTNSAQPWKLVSCANEVTYYVCRKCSMKLKIHCDSTNVRATLWITEGDHEHHQESATTRGISPEVKAEIER